MPIERLLIAALLASMAPISALAQSSVTNPPPVAAAPQIPIDRAQANYEAILRGEKTLFDLAPAQQDEVREFDRRIRAQQPPDHRDPYERCLDDEHARLGREPTALDQRAIEARCR